MANVNFNKPVKKGRPPLPDELKKKKPISSKPRGRPRKSEEEKKARKSKYGNEYYHKNAERINDAHKRWYAEKMKHYNFFLEMQKNSDPNLPEAVEDAPLTADINT